MTIFTGTFIPYEYDNSREVFDYIVERCYKIKRSLRLVEKDTEHLEVRCPMSGDYLTIVGEEQELRWLDNELRVRGWYRTT